MRKKRTNRHLQSFLPRADLYRYVALAGGGFFVLLLGIHMSFQFVLRTAFAGVGEAWDSFAASFSSTSDGRQLTHLVGGLMMAVGGYAVYRGVRGFFKRLAMGGPTPAAGGKALVGSYIKRQQLARGPRIVALGGGTGMSTLLRGLKQYSLNITAIVTVTDDGGSSGRLTQEMGIIPPGDLRNCLVALADAEKRMTDLFQFRFSQGAGALSGHSVGNLMLAGFVEQAGGDYDEALILASEVLAIRGRVIPSTTDRVTLRALMEGGSTLQGETTIVESDLKIQRIYLDPPHVRPHPAAIEAIREADLICIGPGSVYTSIVPNLLVPGIAEAVLESDALKVYICNVMTQPGESDKFSAAEHVVALQANVPNRVFDYVLVNTATPHQDLLAKYRASDQDLVVADTDRIKQMGYKPIPGNFMSESDYVRHDPLRIAARLMDLLRRP
ncbi:MAG: YvcK family protein [Armatimonadetes bacterium]|nr:YvcK family protein [Armatimonadota bacterium]MBS1710466.1 YvcK family protein [Armatimonadota bacterium]MBX3108137.1 YvcK family protein [Fimbriimonadaceae bacterium]